MSKVQGFVACREYRTSLRLGPKPMKDWAGIASLLWSTRTGTVVVLDVQRNAPDRQPCRG